MKTTTSLLTHGLNSGTVGLLRRVRCEFASSSHCFLFFFYIQSGLKDFTFMCPYEVRPSPDVAVLFKHWLCYLWDCSVPSAQVSNSAGHGAREGSKEDGGCLFFF